MTGLRMWGAPGGFTGSLSSRRGPPCGPSPLSAPMTGYCFGDGPYEIRLEVRVQCREKHTLCRACSSRGLRRRRMIRTFRRTKSSPSPRACASDLVVGAVDPRMHGKYESVLRIYSANAWRDRPSRRRGSRRARYTAGRGLWTPGGASRVCERGEATPAGAL